MFKQTQVLGKSTRDMNPDSVGDLKQIEIENIPPEPLLSENKELKLTPGHELMSTITSTGAAAIYNNPAVIPLIGLGAAALDSACLGSFTILFVIISWYVKQKRLKSLMLTTLEDSVVQLVQDYKLFNLIKVINKQYGFQQDDVIIKKLYGKLLLAIVYSLSLFDKKDLISFQNFLEDEVRRDKTKKINIWLSVLVKREIEIKTKRLSSFVNNMTRAIGIKLINPEKFRMELVTNLTIINGLIADIQSKCFIQWFTENVNSSTNNDEIKKSLEYRDYISSNISIPNTYSSMTEIVVDEVDKLMEQAIVEVAQKEEEDLKKEKEKIEANSKIASRLDDFRNKFSAKNTLSKWSVFGDNPIRKNGGKYTRIRRINKVTRKNKRLSKR